MQSSRVTYASSSLERMPLCAAAAIAWGYVVDYPALGLDAARFDRQLRYMEDHLRGSIPVYGKEPGEAEVLKCDLYRAIKGLHPASLPLEWWAVARKEPLCCKRSDSGPHRKSM